MARLSIFTETQQHKFRIEVCCNCGVEFAMTEDFYNERLGDKRLFYCPNGHNQHYIGESWKDQIATLSAEKTALQSRVNVERAGRERAEEKAQRETTKRKRLEKRVGNGVCPYCKRSFVVLARHIHSKHPEKAHA